MKKIREEGEEGTEIKSETKQNELKMGKEKKNREGKGKENRKQGKPRLRQSIELKEKRGKGGLLNSIVIPVR